VARLGFPLLLAVLTTAANAAKPPTIDDGVYLAYAAEFAAHPAHPYSFEAVFNLYTSPANKVLVPPVAVYWLALGTAVGGPNPVWLKVWLFPAVLLFAVAVERLAARFAPGLERPVCLMVLLSPAVLPGWNLMLDLPAAALGLASVVLFLRAADGPASRDREGAVQGNEGADRSLAVAARPSVWFALAAGLLAGLAAQAKYPWLLLPAVFLAWGLPRRRAGPAVLAGGLAVGVFAGWELYLLVVQGETHVLGQAAARAGGPVERSLQNLKAMVPHLGGLLLGGTLLGLAGAGWTGRTLAALAAVAGGGFLAVAAVPEPWAYPVKNAVYVPLGGLAVGVALAGARRLGVGPGTPGGFLLAWLLIEVGGAAVLSPFPAARRWVAVSVVGTLLAARAAALLERRRAAWAAAAVGASLGGGFAAVDTLDAATPAAAGEAATRWAAERSAGRVWHAGCWGFQHAAEASGAKPFLPGRATAAAGEYVIVPDPPLTPEPGIDRNGLEPVWRVEIGDAVPLRTLPGYYAGRAPLEHRDLAAPRAAATVYRATRDVPARWK
jgi:hypothetical protein